MSTLEKWVSIMSFLHDGTIQILKIRLMMRRLLLKNQIKKQNTNLYAYTNDVTSSNESRTQILTHKNCDYSSVRTMHMEQEEKLSV